MIPLRDQDYLRRRFETELINRLRFDLFLQKPSPIYIPGRQECAYCDEARSLAEELAALSSRIALTIHDIEQEEAVATELGVDKVPALVLRGPTNRAVRFFGLPSGTQFANFIEVILDVARGSIELQPETTRQLRKLKTDVRLQVLVTTNCPYSPTMVRTAIKLGLASVRIKVDIIELAEFANLGLRYGIRAAPSTIISDQLLLPGVMDEKTLLTHIFRVVEGKPVTGDFQPGALTPIDPAVFQPQAQTQPPPATTASGLIIPR
jgi:glutaredoxin-like protein